MAEYLSPEVEADATEIEASVYAYIQATYPDWEPREGHLAVLISEAFAQVIEELTVLHGLIPAEIFKSFGTLVGVYPLEPSNAIGYTTWVVRDDAGYVIPASTSVRILVSGSDYALFNTTEDVLIPSGQLTTASGAVLIRAVEEGVSSSGLTGEVELQDVLDYVVSVTLESPTTGGFDAEEEEDYLDRLSDRLQLMADRPILAEDFSIYAKTIEGVFRVVTLDNYNPADDTFGNEKMVCSFMIDEDGQPVSAPVKAAVTAAIEEVRELNFVFNTDDPDYTVVNIVATVRALEGYDLSEMDSRITSLTEDYLNPATWGSNPNGDERSWVNSTKVRYLEVATALSNMEGVDYVESLTINGVAGDLTMTGRVSLPDAASTVAVTVNAPA